MKDSCVLRLAAHATLIVWLGLGCAATSAAHSGGVSGLSGKSSGFFCRNCHAGGTAPTVAFDGPTAMEPGSSATFSFTIAAHAAGQIAAGLDVAASDGTLGLAEGQGTILLLGEVTHSEPKANGVTGQATFEFTWQAPATAGTYTLFGAGCSVNGNSQTSGDAAARTTYEVFVGIAPPPPTPTATPTSGTNCVGDCGEDGEVTVNELITGVNIALGVAPLSACPVFDANGDGEVTVNEILQAVNNALNGCPL
jgi:hypothetical protein